MSERNVPRLRFPGFEGEWKNTKLKNHFQLISGQHLNPDDYSTENKNDKPYFTGPSDFTNDESRLTKWAKITAKIAFKDDILFTVKGSGVGSLMYLHLPQVAMGRQLMAIRSIDSSTALLCQILQTKKQFYESLAVGNMIPGLSRGDILETNIVIPEKSEQDKLADFIIALDKKTTSLNKKKFLLEKYKNGMMQKIFNQEIWFKDEDEKDYREWEEKTFGEVIYSVASKKYQTKSSEVSLCGTFRVVDQGKDLIAGYSNEEDKVFSNLPVIVFGDHTTILKYIDFDFVVGADGTKLLKSSSENLKYIYYYLQLNNVDQEGYKRHFSILSKVSIDLPELAEQTKIANFLSSIDDKINLVAVQIEKMEKFKKGLLGEMFV